MVFINFTETIGKVILAGTEGTSGSFTITLIMILILIIALAIMFGIQLEYTAILILPLTLACMSYYSDFVTFGMILLIYFAFILTKNFIFK